MKYWYFVIVLLSCFFALPINAMEITEMSGHSSSGSSDGSTTDEESPTTSESLSKEKSSSPMYKLHLKLGKPENRISLVEEDTSLEVSASKQATPETPFIAAKDKLLSPDMFAYALDFTQNMTTEDLNTLYNSFNQLPADILNNFIQQNPAAFAQLLGSIGQKYLPLKADEKQKLRESALLLIVKNNKATLEKVVEDNKEQKRICESHKELLAWRLKALRTSMVSVSVALVWAIIATCFAMAK